MLRHLVVVSAFSLLAGTSAFAQATVGSSCTVSGTGAFLPVCDATTAAKLDVCQPATQGATTGTVTAVDCTTFAAGAACGDPPGCNGSGCAAIDPTGAKTCVQSNVTGGACDGLAPDINQDTTKQQTIGLVLCSGDASCVTTVNPQATPPATDACAAHVGAACTAGADAASCTGTTLSICLEDSGKTAAIASNLVLDCATLGGGSTCATQQCQCDTQCSSDGSSKCVNGTCDFGVTCTTPVAQLPACGTGGEGEGEGEGEGAAGHCAQDRDCGQDQVCDNGTCKASTTPPENKPTCSDTGVGGAAPLAGLVAIIGLVPMFRRRRA
jgi:hypothetical protein